jgi:hypothetical protein
MTSPNKTVWFFTRQTSQLRTIWAHVYGAKIVRRAQWLRVLVIAVDALTAAAPFVDDKDASLVIKSALDDLERQVSQWQQHA